MIVKKPWGNFVTLTQNTPSTIKIITINDGHRTSLQSHKNRDEYWYIIKGKFEITIGLETCIGVEGMHFQVMKNTKHRIKGLSNDNQLLEVSQGIFNENDITRYDDDYNRS